MAMNSHRHVDDWLTHLCWKTGTALNIIILGAWYMYVLIVHRSMFHSTVHPLSKQKSNGHIGQMHSHRVIAVSSAAGRGQWSMHLFSAIFLHLVAHCT